MLWGDLLSQFRHYDLYRALSRYQWKTVLRLFEQTATTLCADPASSILSVAQREGLRGALPVLRERGHLDPQLDDEAALDQVAVRWHGAKLDEAAFRLFFQDQGLSPFRAMLELDASTLDELRALHQHHGAMVFTGPHLGSYGAGLPILVELFKLRRSAAYYQLDPQTHTKLSQVMACSSMPESITPELVDQARPREDMIRFLRERRSVFLLSDSTSVGRNKGKFRGQMLGRSFHAPTGPFRVAATAGVPLACAAITRAPDYSFRVHLELLWAPRDAGPSTLSDAELEVLVQRKWAVFEDYFEHDPLSWEGLEFWSRQPAANPNTNC